MTVKMSFNSFKTSLIWFLIILVNVSLADANYNTHWIEGDGRIEQMAQASSSHLNVYCYRGKPKLAVYLLQSVILHLDIKSDNFYQYVGFTPQDVWDSFKADSAVWTPNIFTPKKSRHLYLHPFNQTCIAISTTQSYTLQLEVKNFDEWRVCLLIVGLILFLCAKSLGENTLFYYAVGIIIGISASFMILVYILSRMLPGRPIIYGTMVGGWAVGIYFFQMIWSNFQPLLIAYRTYVMWYILITGFISFIICYRRGPPKDQRSKNIIAWTLQISGLVAMYFCTDIFDGVIALWLCAFVLRYVPLRCPARLKRYWLYKFPPKRVLLTEEQYYEEGIRETAKALEELRGYCSSPECSQWKLIGKLRDPSRFADFITKGEHVTEKQVFEYDSGEFFIHRPKVQRPTPVTSTLGEEDFTSDDSSFSGDELQ